MQTWTCPGCGETVTHDDPVGPEGLAQMQEPNGRMNRYVNNVLVHQCEPGIYGG
jgi:hypothetical protein